MTTFIKAKLKKSNGEQYVCENIINQQLKMDLYELFATTIEFLRFLGN